jgi:hypothetical protein
MWLCTCVCVCMRALVCVFFYACYFVYACTQVMYVCVCMRVCVCVNVCARTHTYTYTHTYIHTYMRKRRIYTLNIHACIYTHISVCKTNSHKHAKSTYIHKHTHTYVHRHTHTFSETHLFPRPICKHKYKHTYRNAFFNCLQNMSRPPHWGLGCFLLSVCVCVYVCAIVLFEGTCRRMYIFIHTKISSLNVLSLLG